ncbi:MAG: hypothetical protein ICV53_14630 [Flavisolibacter sp.]|nr:hypothetical protein [Flavisolibacter sp.]
MNETEQIGKGIKTNIVEILVKLPEENVILIKLDSFVNKANLQSLVYAELSKIANVFGQINLNGFLM